MTDFKLNCCRLFEQFPLYDYRIPDSDEPGQKLCVLLIGYGSRMETILQEVLTQGQLLNTKLIVSVANSNAEGTCSALLKRAPYLPHFARICVDSNTISDPEPKDLLCTLHFETIRLSPEAMPQVLAAHSESSYLIISTGRDEKNRALAESLAQFQTKQKTLITYVQKKDADDAEVLSPLSELHAFSSRKEDSYRRQIEQIALNMHWVYSKSQNERISCQEILRKFQDPYTYTSNIEAALHIRAKLACCGITDDDLSAAAARFSKIISSSPETIELLSALEHRRWVLSKVLDSYRQLESIDWIYQNGASTHDSKAKWHCCLVSCDPLGKSRLTDEDWENASVRIRPELDELDRISLQVYEQCRKISEMTAGSVDALLQTIKKFLTDSPDYSLLTLKTYDDLELAVIQMRQHKQSAIARYKTALSSLKDQIKTGGGVLSGLLNSSLESLENSILPLIEYISRKDYKLQDRILVSQIPFCLTHKLQPVLIKVLSDKDTDNLFSFWQLEPRTLVFLASASDGSELDQFKTKAENISRFVKNSGWDCGLRYYICVPDALSVSQQPDADSSEYHLIPAPDWTLEGLSQVLQPIVSETDADYLDITGGEPLLTRAAELCAASCRTASFYTRNGRMLNLRGAEELSFTAPSKSLTVREMFELSGAVLSKSEAQKTSDLLGKFSQLWDIYRGHHGDWKYFCSAVMNAYAKTPKNIEDCVFGFRYSGPESPNRQLKSVPSGAARALMPQLRKMELLGFVSGVSSVKTFGDSCDISFTVNPQYISPQKLEDTLRKCCYSYQPSYCYSFRKNEEGRIVFACDELQVTGMPNTVRTESNYELRYYKILNELNKYGLIRNYRTDQATNTCEFQFSSIDVKNCLETSGTVLEYFVYYTALTDSQFTDVDMGFEFFHSASGNAAKNELDVLCTKGLSSMFISCKARSMDFFENNLNYVIYEVSLLAEKFGINPKICIAAPAISQFQTDRFKNRRFTPPVYNALKRGVYVLGKECLKDSATLGRVLNNIMDGREDWCEFI